MKKVFSALLIALCLVAPLTMGRATVSADDGLGFNAADIMRETEEFCKMFGDRTSFTEAGRVAAQGIADALSAGGNLNVEIQSFDKTIWLSRGLGYDEKTLTSYNVVVSPKAVDAKKPTVLIMTNYANHFSDSDIFRGVNAEGALGTGATTVLTMLLANNLPQRVDDYNLKFAFFSATDEGNFGSEAYIDKYLTSDVIFAINLERLGCGDTYYYTDEIETSHGKYVEGTVPDTFKPFPEAGRVLLDGEVIDGVPYSHYANRGDVASFMSAGRSCLELIGGKFSGLGDGEGSNAFVTNTSADTYENLVANHPDYADKLMEVANYIVTLTDGDGLKDAATGAATSYKVFTHAWVAYVICLGIIIALILALILVSNRFEKKYPIPEMPKIKIAVFGKDYEEPGANEILIDIKRNDNEEKDGNDENIDPFEKK